MAITGPLQTNSANAGSVTLGHCAFSSNVSPGSLLVCTVRMQQAGVTMSMTDSLGNTWVYIDDNQGGSTCLFMFYCANSLAGANTVNVTWGGTAATMRITVAEYQGADPVTPLDVHNQASATGTLVSIPLTTSFDQALLVIGVNTALGSVETGGSAQYTVREAVNNFLGYADGYGVTAGPETGLINLATSSSWGGIIAAFRAPADTISVNLVPRTDHRIHEYGYQC